jgi:hypothetical protein
VSRLTSYLITEKYSTASFLTERELSGGADKVLTLSVRRRPAKGASHSICQHVIPDDEPTARPDANDDLNAILGELYHSYYSKSDAEREAT